MSEVVDLDLPADTYDLAIVKPGTDKPNGWVVTLAGPAHPKTLAYKDAAQRERLRKEAAVEAQQLNGRKIKPDERTPDEADLRGVQWLVSRIVTWTPVKIGDEVIAFSDEAATQLLLRPAMAPYAAQITEYLVSEGAFIAGSAIN